MTQTINGQAPLGHLYIGICSNRTGPTWELSKALEFASVELFTKGWLVSKGRAGSSDIEDGRNQLFTHFLNNPAYTHALFLDDDVHWEGNAIWRMVNHPVDFVLGAYPKRMDGEGFPISMLDEPIDFVDPITREPDPQNGLLRIAGGPGGMMRITRLAAERMVAARTADDQKRARILAALKSADLAALGLEDGDMSVIERLIQEDGWYHQPVIPGTKKAWNVFEFTVRNHVRRSEDKQFCFNWRSQGGDVWCDPHLMLHHHGEKTYSGCFAHYLRHVGLKPPGRVVKVELKGGPADAKSLRVASQERATSMADLIT